MFKKFRNNFTRWVAKNAMSLPNQFLRYGNSGGTMYPGWDNVVMSDEDHYTGYSYAAIRNRANAVSRVAKEFIHTETGKKNDTFVHPYLAQVRDSKYFSESMFWYWISTYLDLEGVFYLMVLRNKGTTVDGKPRIGDPVYFKLLNPYNITRVLQQDTLEVGSYIETRKGFQRVFTPEMIIEIRDMNPFDEDKPFAMTDAARDSSFTLKTAGDFTRQTLKNNINAPGILSTDVVLPKEEFKNFTARVKDHVKGEPLFGNGAGVIDWKDMNIDMNKASLADVNEINRDALLAVSGVSKTILGIEQSGTTRETANVQKDLMIENQVVPRIELILDALNLDYKNRYPEAFLTTNASLAIRNPIDSDQDTEQKKVAIKQDEFDLFDELVAAGYDEVTAAKYAQGEIKLGELGKPKGERRPPETRPITVAPTADTPKKTKKSEFVPHFVTTIGDTLDTTINDLQEDQEASLQNALVNIEMDLAVAAINKIPKLIKKNDIRSESELLTPAKKKESADDLFLVLMAFFGIIVSLQGKENAKARAAEYGMSAQFLLDKIAKDGIKETARKVATSHIDTVSKDLYDTAKALALEGKGQAEIISALKTKYAHDITEIRAKAVARTETNRAFTMAQYDADRQFIEQNGLEGRAYKQYETRSDNPCKFCEKIQSEGLIPFDEPFRKVGETVVAVEKGKEKTFTVSFADVNAGNLHTNCNCIYRLVIKAK